MKHCSLSHALTFVLLLLYSMLFTQPVSGSSITGSPHDLSANVYANDLRRIKTTAEFRICVFCHTPHHSTVLSGPSYPGPLWNREENTNAYTT